MLECTRTTGSALQQKLLPVFPPRPGPLPPSVGPSSAPLPALISPWTTALWDPDGLCTQPLPPEEAESA